MKEVLLYIWQLPQNILGLLFLLIIRGEQKHKLNGIDFFYSQGFQGGISLGKYIITGSKGEVHIRHEFGHCIQSKILGWFYLPIVGICSGLHAWLCKCRRHSYYDFWTERWADKLGNIKR